jgi:hypothetical protein
MNPVLIAGGTAAVFSGRVRSVLRRGIVYGVAGVLSAGEAVVGAARGVAHGAETAASTTTRSVGEIVGDAREMRHPKAPPPRRRPPRRTTPTPSDTTPTPTA